MTEIIPRGSQLDRIDDKLDQILDRLTRMEARQDNHGSKIEAHDSRIDELSIRLRDVETAYAVINATSQQTGKTLQGRWAAVGATALVILAAIGGFIGNALLKVLHIGS